jgi:RecA/RadA recombinase
MSIIVLHGRPPRLRRELSRTTGAASFRTNARPVHLHGSLAVDRALGVGGVPRSRITEIFGPEGGGKATLAQHIVAEAQKLGGTAVYIDMEHAVDLAYMQA